MTAKKQIYMVFDVESVGLHGTDFSVGFVVVNQHGAELDADIFTCDFNETYGNQDALEWCRKNIPSLKKTHLNPAHIRDDFWKRWTIWRLQGALLVADCAWPVEARFLINCVNESPEEREWKGPYPLIDVASVLMAKGANPLSKLPREEGELPEHNPLCDARQSARVFLEHL